MLQFDVAVTLDDQVQVGLFLLNEPAMRRRLLLRQGLVLPLPLVGGLLAATTHWLFNGRGSYADAIIEFWRDLRSPELLSAFLIVSAVLLAIFVALRLLRPRLLRRQLRKLLRERADADSADPALTEACRCTLGPDGFTATGRATSLAYTWAAIRSLAETPGQLMLRTGGMNGFILPKRQLSAAQTDAIRAMVARRVAL